MLALLLAACASTPQALRGDFPGPEPATASDSSIGQSVRWGGRLLEVRPEANRTCFEILALPLDDTAQPQQGAEPGRRFLACRDGFVDPAAFPVDRLVTVTGRLARFVTRAIGGYDYRYPVVSVRVIHLWPKPLEPRAYPAAPWYYDPWYHDPWYPRFRDPWGRPYGW